MTKYHETSCSQCGRSFGPGDEGYSHCDQHATSPSAEQKVGLWMPIDDEAKQMGRCLIAWEAFGGIGPHVELGKFKAGVGWCNTYGKFFSSAPDFYMALPAPPTSSRG